jgi:LysR family transcriptional regulator, low CO2-responsive transcriptional regulator
MNYTLNQLRIFLKIAETCSITKAAEELHLTQPAVSIQLKNFQDQFDIALTEVIGKRLFITDFGREIAAAAENILNEAYAISYKTQAYKGQLSGRLRISVVSTGKYVMPYFLTGFIKQHEAVELQMDVTNKARVVESLENNEVDFSLVSVLPQQLKLHTIELMPNKLFLIGKNETKVATRSKSIKIFEQVPLIFREPGSATRTAMEHFIRSNGLQVKKKIELTSNEAVKQSVLAGLGYSVMPLIGLKNELINGQLQLIPVKGLPIKTSWNLVWLHEKKVTPIASAFISYLEKQKNAVIDSEFAWLTAY